MANFNEAAINGIFDSVVSHAAASGYFDSVNAFEPKNAPGNGVTCAVWAQSIQPIRAGGQAATSGTLLLQARVYTSFISQPFDMIDPNVTAAACYLMGAYSGDFEFGSADADVRMVDLLGAYGPSLSAVAGYVEMDKQIFRIMTISIPIVVNDLFAQVS